MGPMHVCHPLPLKIVIKVPNVSSSSATNDRYHIVSNRRYCLLSGEFFDILKASRDCQRSGGHFSGLNVSFAIIVHLLNLTHY